MRKPIFRLFNKYKLYHFLFFIFFIITSCDEKYVPLLEESEISTEYVQKNFVLNAEKSTLPISPDYLNQDLSSRVYIGTVDDDRMSYAIFEIQSDIMSKYGLCDDTTLDDEIESVDSILFRVVFDSPIINTYNNSYSLDPPNDEMINNFDFEDNIENDIAILNTNFKSYYSDNSGVVFNEDDLANHVPENIENTIELIKSDGNIISSRASTNYKLDLNLSDYIDIDNLCNQSLDKFYILMEYIPPNTIFKENFDIVSSDHFYMDHHPSLIINYKKESTTDSLINKYNITGINSDLETYISQIILLDEGDVLDNQLSDIGTNNNFVLANVDEDSDGYGTILGYSSGDINGNSTPIIPASDSLALFDITIDLSDEFQSDSIIFYFSDIMFGYQSINNSYDFGEEHFDYGLDQCPDDLETGDTSECAETSSESLYNPNGTEDNGVYDEGELWDDLGLDWLAGTNTFGVNDDYETGCKSTTYPYGIGYGSSDNSTETYNEIISQIGGIDFYKQYFTLNNGEEIQVCGKQFWNNPNSDEGVSSCSTCNINDPNGDNKNIDPSNDDWRDVEGNLIGDYNENDIWDENEPLEQNGQWDWVDVDGDDIFNITIDLYESFFDYGIDQLPDNLESGNINDDNYSNNNLEGTENNNYYDIGEIFNDDGIDNVSTVQEEYYNRYGRENNDEVDIVDEIFKEYSDFGLDQCPNGYETGDINNPCDDIENEDGDLNFDDINIDPNNDNYSSDNLEGTENNFYWDYEDENEDEEWNWIDENSNSSFEWDFDTYEPCEYFSEVTTPLTALYVVGENLYNVDLQTQESTQLFDKPLSLGIEDIILWISKIEKIDENDDKYKITISISSSIDVSAFQFKLGHIPHQEAIPYSEPNTTQMFPLDFDDLNDNNLPDNGEINEDIKYISDYSLYALPEENASFFNNEIILSYGYGTKWNFYFDDLNDFLYSNNQSLFISEQQTYLIIYFDIDSENHDVSEEGVGLNFSGSIGNDILIENYIPSQLIFDDTSQLSIQIGSLINELLSKSNTIFQNESDIINAIINHMELSLSSYSYNFSKVALDVNSLPQISILYSE